MAEDCLSVEAWLYIKIYNNSILWYGRGVPQCGGTIVYQSMLYQYITIWLLCASVILALDSNIGCSMLIWLRHTHISHIKSSHYQMFWIIYCKNYGHLGFLHYSTYLCNSECSTYCYMMTNPVSDRRTVQGNTVPRRTLYQNTRDRCRRQSPSEHQHLQ